MTRRVGAITIDGDLSDEGWKDVTASPIAIHCLPGPLCPATSRAEGRITYDDDNLYIALTAYDDHPELIRASMRSRDDIWNDDFMGIILDTYGDASRAFEFYANPLGIQGDLLWGSNGNEDANYDMIYQTEAKITPTGWQLEMRIPLKSLRFPDKDIQNWHMTYWRMRPREQGERISWAPLNFYEPSLFRGLGVLTGIEHIKSSTNLEIMPTVVAKQYASAPSAGDALVSQPVKISPSLDVRYGFSPSLSAELAINPDFSQVEADASQVSVNSTFALFYPEHRPFFQDGSDLFNTSISAVYSRSINDPIGVGKVLSRDGATSFAYVGALDQHTPLIIPLEERSDYASVGKSTVNIARVSHVLGDDSFIGALLTDRRYEQDGSNTVGGIDGKVLLGNSVEFYGQALLSHTKELAKYDLLDTDRFDGGKYSVNQDGESFLGEALTLGIQRYTQHLDMSITYSDVSPGFRAGDGFVTSANSRGLGIYGGYKDQFATGLFQQLALSGYTEHDWNFDGLQKQSIVKFNTDWDFRNQSSLHWSYKRWDENYHRTEFSNLWRFGGSFDTRLGEALAIGASFSAGAEIAKNVDTPLTGRLMEITASAELKALQSLLFQPRMDYVRMIAPDGSMIFEGAIYHLFGQYQFTREISLKINAEYNSFSHISYLDPLLQYQLNPFTSFYIGSTHSFLSGGPYTGFIASERQIFAKVQYLLRT